MSVYLSAQIDLYSPPGTDFDLYVYCDSCASSVATSSTIGGTSGHTDTVTVRAEEEAGIDDTFSVWIEVRHDSTDICGTWSLDIWGNTYAETATCD